MSELDKELRQAGDKVAEGRFRIDAKRALERLKGHRFAEPSHWVLEVLRAAALSGATRVAVRTDADDVEVAFDGRAFPQGVMKDLLGQGLVAGSTPETKRARLLGLGVAGALGVSPQHLVVESGGLRVSVTPDAEVTVEPCEGRGTRLSLRKRLGWRVAAAVLRGAPEAAAIRQRCRGFGPKLTLNGASLEALDLAKATRRHVEGAAVWAAEASDGAEVSEVTLEWLGVEVARRVLTLPGVQLRAWVRGDDFRTNASGSDVVDNDPALVAALQALGAWSLDGLQRQVARLRAEPDEALRGTFVARLLRDDTPKEARAILEEAPVIPGPSGERLSVAELQAEVKAGRPLHVATSLYPEGTYPKPTVLHPTAWAKLLPQARQVDVAEQVQRNRRAAENRKAWLAEPLERPALSPDDDVFSRVLVDTPQLEGQVALHDGSHGAFVRLLCAGRFLQQGDVPALSPLRLRAVINLKRELPPKSWQDVPSGKLFSFVTDEVLAAATQAILGGPGEGEGQGRTVEGALLPHARDLLARLLRDGPGRLPAPLRRVPLFQVVGGGPALSLEALEGLKPWRFVTQRMTYPLLSGEPVLQLTIDEHALLKALKKERLEDATLRLMAEREVRRRLTEGPKEDASLEHCDAVIPLSAGGMSGQVGVRRGTGSQRLIALYRDGFRLDEALVPSALPQLRAAVDCPGLTPDARWEKAVRDEAFEAVVKGVRAHEDRVAAEVVRQYPEWTFLPPTCAEYLSRWARQGLSSSPAATDEVKVVETLRFATSQGARTLAQLRDEVAAQGHLWVLGNGVRGVPPEVLVVAANPLGAEVLARATGLQAEDATAEVARALAERGFLARPLHDGRLPPDAFPRAVVERPGVRLEAGVSGTSRSCGVEVLLQRRLLLVETLPTRLPLVALAHVEGLSGAVRYLPPEWRERLDAALLAAEARIVEAALEHSDEPAHRRVLLEALAVRYDRSALPALAQRLLDWPGFRCTDGRVRTARQFDARDAVCFSDSVDGELPDGTPVVRVEDDDERRALARFRTVRSVTAELVAAHEARARRAKLFARAELRVEAEARWRRAFTTAAMSGEVAIVSRDAGWLELLMEMKPLCLEHDALAEPLAAAVNCDTLAPVPDHTGVVHDAAYAQVLEHVEHGALALAGDVAADWPSLDEAAKARHLADVVALGFWVARVKKAHPLLECAVLESTDGRPLSLSALRGEGEKKAKGKKKTKKVPYSERSGRPLDEAKVVWRPRPGELERAKGLGLPLEDVSAQLQHADSVRSRPRKDTLRAPLDGAWREVIAGRTAHGEVALPEAPSQRLEVHVLQGMTPLEVYVTEHPVGGVAEVNCDALRANADWTKVVRNQAFRDALGEVEAALDVLVTRRLVAGPGEDAPTWLAWASAALAWRREVGPLAKVLPTLGLFERLDGAPVTLGEVLAEHSRRRRVAVATEGTAPEGSLVLKRRSGALRMQMLATLGLEVEDVTRDLLLAHEVEASRRARRLASLEWQGQALVRLDVKAPGLLGQLALPLSAAGAVVQLAREGVPVGAADVGGPPGIAGVLDVAELPVDDGWTRARPTPAQVTAIRQAMESVYGELAKRAGEVTEAHRPAVLERVLAFLRHAGVTSAAHLDRMTGAAAALARVALFRTVDGRVVALRAVADEVLTRGKVPVMKRRLLKPDVGEAFVLEAEALNEPWVEALLRLLGEGVVERVDDVAAWRAARAEVDPPKDTPEWRGLERLRREVRLLRAGALGRLTPGELEDVRLSRAGGKAPLRYDRKRKVVLLDPDDEGVRRALVEYRSRPERLFALVAAVYGAVNRELDHVTDAHEAELLLALAGHLAANPKLLEPRGDAETE